MPKSPRQFDYLITDNVTSTKLTRRNCLFGLEVEQRNTGLARNSNLFNRILNKKILLSKNYKRKQQNENEKDTYEKMLQQR